MAKKVKVVYLKPLMSVAESDKQVGKLLQESDCIHLFKEDVDVYDKESGNCIAKFRKKVIPGNMVASAYGALLKAAKQTNNRGSATMADEKGEVSTKRLNKNGTISNTTIAKGGAVESGIIGYFDRNARFPYCRLTAFNQHDMPKFQQAYPIIKFVDDRYKELMPEHYKLQRKMADKTSQDFVIKGTSFTTVTVNRNWQTAVHKDQGDFRHGFGNLVALRNGKYLGGHFVVVRWGCGFDLQNGDLLLVDVHQWHGNTPIRKDNDKVVRLSLVMYYRENMIHCETMEKELKRVKNRRLGDSLNG